jgi:hypothetical protein
VRHGNDPQLWPAVLAIVSAVLVFAAVIALVVINPGKPKVYCRYASGSVTVEVDGPDCASVMRFVTADSDRAWVASKTAPGAVYSQLKKGNDTVRIYDHGEPEFARAIAGHFQNARWTYEAPAPSPVPS